MLIVAHAFDQISGKMQILLKEKPTIVLIVLGKFSWLIALIVGSHYIGKIMTILKDL